ncbi:hypothetical protein PR048_033002 [Dryococelus australis]|uniref:Uncharacterized protein n=1 Tax=Dryococelus australis TaxID=614101 RepID=A0ABQ9G4L2_9NEOP|nr:hypothetical protein PR048_033002 [Dryococelus australis]
MSAYTRQKAKSKYRNRIRLERAPQKQSSDAHKTPYDRVKRCRELDPWDNGMRAVTSEVHVHQSTVRCSLTSYCGQGLAATKAGIIAVRTCGQCCHICWEKCHQGKFQNTRLRIHRLWCLTSLVFCSPFFQFSYFNVPRCHPRRMLVYGSLLRAMTYSSPDLLLHSSTCVSNDFSVDETFYLLAVTLGTALAPPTVTKTVFASALLSQEWKSEQVLKYYDDSCSSVPSWLDWHWSRHSPRASASTLVCAVYRAGLVLTSATARVQQCSFLVGLALVASQSPSISYSVPSWLDWHWSRHSPRALASTLVCGAGLVLTSAAARVQQCSFLVGLALVASQSPSISYSVPSWLDWHWSRHSPRASASTLVCRAGLVLTSAAARVQQCSFLVGLALVASQSPSISYSVPSWLDWHWSRHSPRALASTLVCGAGLVLTSAAARVQQCSFLVGLALVASQSPSISYSVPSWLDWHWSRHSPRASASTLVCGAGLVLTSAAARVQQCSFLVGLALVASQSPSISYSVPSWLDWHWSRHSPRASASTLVCAVYRAGLVLTSAAARVQQCFLLGWTGTGRVTVPEHQLSAAVFLLGWTGTGRVTVPEHQLVHLVCRAGLVLTSATARVQQCSFLVGLALVASQSPSISYSVPSWLDWHWSRHSPRASASTLVCCYQAGLVLTSAAARVQQCSFLVGLALSAAVFLLGWTGTGRVTVPEHQLVHWSVFLLGWTGTGRVTVPEHQLVHWCAGWAGVLTSAAARVQQCSFLVGLALVASQSPSISYSVPSWLDWHWSRHSPRASASTLVCALFTGLGLVLTSATLECSSVPSWLDWHWSRHSPRASASTLVCRAGLVLTSATARVQQCSFLVGLALVRHSPEHQLVHWCAGWAGVDVGPARVQQCSFLVGLALVASQSRASASTLVCRAGLVLTSALLECSSVPSWLDWHWSRHSPEHQLVHWCAGLAGVDVGPARYIGVPGWVVLTSALLECSMFFLVGLALVGHSPRASASTWCAGWLVLTSALLECSSVPSCWTGTAVFLLGGLALSRHSPRASLVHWCAGLAGVDVGPARVQQCSFLVGLALYIGVRAGLVLTSATARVQQCSFLVGLALSRHSPRASASTLVSVPSWLDWHWSRHSPEHQLVHWCAGWLVLTSALLECSSVPSWLMHCRVTVPEHQLVHWCAGLAGVDVGPARVQQCSFLVGLALVASQSRASASTLVCRAGLVLTSALLDPRASASTLVCGLVVLTSALLECSSVPSWLDWHWSRHSPRASASTLVCRAGLVLTSATARVQHPSISSTLVRGLAGVDVGPARVQQCSFLVTALVASQSRASLVHWCAGAGVDVGHFRVQQCSFLVGLHWSRHSPRASAMQHVPSWLDWHWSGTGRVTVPEHQLVHWCAGWAGVDVGPARVQQCSFLVGLALVASQSPSISYSVPSWLDWHWSRHSPRASASTLVCAVYGWVLTSAAARVQQCSFLLDWHWSRHSPRASASTLVCRAGLVLTSATARVQQCSFLVDWHWSRHSPRASASTLVCRAGLVLTSATARVQQCSFLVGLALVASQSPSISYSVPSWLDWHWSRHSPRASASTLGAAGLVLTSALLECSSVPSWLDWHWSRHSPRASASTLVSVPSWLDWHWSRHSPRASASTLVCGAGLVLTSAAARVQQCSFLVGLALVASQSPSISYSVPSWLDWHWSRHSPRASASTLVCAVYRAGLVLTSATARVQQCSFFKAHRNDGLGPHNYKWLIKNVSEMTAVLQATDPGRLSGRHKSLTMETLGLNSARSSITMQSKVAAVFHGEGGSSDGKVVRLLAPHLREPGSIPGGVAPGFLYVGIVPDDAAGQRIFSGISCFPCPCIPALLHTHLASPSSALKNRKRLRLETWLQMCDVMTGKRRQALLLDGIAQLSPHWLQLTSCQLRQSMTCRQALPDLQAIHFRVRNPTWVCWGSVSPENRLASRYSSRPTYRCEVRPRILVCGDVVTDTRRTCIIIVSKAPITLSNFPIKLLPDTLYGDRTLVRLMAEPRTSGHVGNILTRAHVHSRFTGTEKTRLRWRQ